MTEAEAWVDYRQAVEEMRRLVLDHPMTARNDQVRAEAMALIHQAQAAAYLMVLAPRQDYPRWFAHSFFEPNVFNWNLPNPDFLYRVCFLDGRRSYRITGKRNTGHWVDIQSVSGNFGEEGVVYNGNYNLDDFEIGPDGRFEITVSAEKAPGNWIRIEPDAPNNMLQLRRLIYDWEAEEPPYLNIERLGDAPGLVNLDEAELARRVALAGRFIRHVIKEMNLKGIERMAGVEDNQFIMIDGEKLKANTANPIAVYGQARYALEPGEALIVESDIPAALYWNIHLGDIWNQTRDFVNFTSTLNGRQARLDGDGRLRAVISLSDPGVPNWLDPVGTTFGRVTSRWYGADSAPRPSIRRVALADLRDHLPPDTPVVGPDARRATVRARRDAMLRHWSY